MVGLAAATRISLFLLLLLLLLLLGTEICCCLQEGELEPRFRALIPLYCCPALLKNNGLRDIVFFKTAKAGGALLAPCNAEHEATEGASPAAAIFHITDYHSPVNVKKAFKMLQEVQLPGVLCQLHVLQCNDVSMLTILGEEG
jgi:hypothetical protein